MPFGLAPGRGRHAVSALHTRSRGSYGEWVADGDGAGEEGGATVGDVLTDAVGDGGVRTDGEAVAVGGVDLRTEGAAVAVGAWYVYDGAVAG
jgi:hypothetical protein